MATLFSLEYSEYPQHIYKHVIRVVPNNFDLSREEFDQFMKPSIDILIESFKVWCVQRHGELVYEGKWAVIESSLSFYFKDQNDAFEFKMRFG